MWSCGAGLYHVGPFQPFNDIGFYFEYNGDPLEPFEDLLTVKKTCLVHVLRINSTGNTKDRGRPDQRVLQDPKLGVVAAIHSGYIGDIF